MLRPRHTLVRCAAALGLFSSSSFCTAASIRPKISQDKARNGLITIAPADGIAHTATFIGPIHGLGDTNMGWADAANQLHVSSLRHVKFVLPNAPTSPVTLNGGMAMPSWYDITSLDDRANQECVGIEESRATVTAQRRCPSQRPWRALAWAVARARLMAAASETSTAVAMPHLSIWRA